MKGFNHGLVLFISMLIMGQVIAAQPPAPTGVNATDGVYPDHVQVTWNPVAGVPIYRVQRCTAIGSGCERLSYQTGSSLNDGGGRFGVLYYYHVRACNHLGECSKLSEADSGYRGIRVSAGQSGSWFDPTHNGEGFFLEVLSDTLAAVVWFTYDKYGKQVWIAGIGEISDSKIMFPEMVSPHGGKFGPDFDPADVSRPVWGTLKFEFSDCNNAVVRYSGPKGFGDGHLNVVPLTKIWGLNCNGTSSSNVSSGLGFLNAGFSASWYDPDHDGEGFVIEILSETRAVVMWFTYDTEGNPAWLSALAEIIGTTIFIENFQVTSGPVFGQKFKLEDVVHEDWGPATFTFTSCGYDGLAGSMQYSPPPEFGSQSGQSLYRLTSIAGVECKLLTGSYGVSGVMDVVENIFIDGDVNDPNVPETSNDLDAQAQVLKAPAKVVGFATALPTGSGADRFAVEADEWDIFQLPLQGGETVTLEVSDWNADDPLANDIDLYLWRLDEPDVVIDSSENTSRTEWLSAPDAGVYLVGVHAFSGASNYLLKSGQSSPTGFSRLSSSASMAKGGLIAALRDQDKLMSISDQKAYRSRIASLEKENALTRVKENSDGAVLYAVDTSRVDRLVPHPLTLKGRGSITAENWQVVRVAKQLSVNQDYRWSGPNYMLHGLKLPNDPDYGLQWHYPLINLPLAWDFTTGSEDVVVAVIDTGVSEHQDLVSNVDYSLGYDFVASPLNSGDGDGADPDARDPGELFPVSDYLSHGTHVAGTVGAAGNNGTGLAGVNWGVTIMPVRVLGVDVGGSCWDVSQGMKWAGGLANDSGTRPPRIADVINLSLGGSSVCEGSQELVDQLVAAGIMVVAAAGNDASAIPQYPASLTNIVSVSATTVVDELAYYSSFGPGIDIAAPGGDVTADLDDNGDPDGVLSTVMIVPQGSSAQTTGYTYFQGTSMASPHVAGVAALMKSVYPEMGTSELFTAISSGEITKDLADDGLTNKDPSFGYGRIDAQQAINWALEQGAIPIPPYLRSSISSADFGSTQLSISFDIRRGGTGDIVVTGDAVSDTWLKLIAVDTDDEGLGSYRIVVDRAGLVDGAYSGWAAIKASDGSEVLISVSMHTGKKVAGEAGYQYALLIDSLTLEDVAQWEGLASDGQYPIVFSNIPFGFYFLLVGSDIDNDSTLCDEGEFCQVYPLNNSPGEIIVWDRNVDLGRFTLRFPENSELGNIASFKKKP